MRTGIKTPYRLLPALLLSVILPSCSKDLPLPEIKKENKIVLLGELVAGEHFYLRAGQSLAVVNNNNEPLNFRVLNNLAVTVKENAGNVHDMKGQEDEFTPTLFTIPYTLDKPVGNGTIYTISATHSALGTVTATVQIPAQIDAAVTDTVSARYATDNTLKIKIRLKDPANKANYYVIEALKQIMNITGYYFHNNNWNAIADDTAFYRQLKAAGNVVTRFDTTYQASYTRQAIYSADPLSENVQDNGSFTSGRRVLIRDVQFNGTDYETTVYVVQHAADSFLETRGRTIVYIKSVSEDYFQFLKGYEVYLPTVDYNSINQPVKIRGNVQNGYGMVGGVSQVTFTYINDKWNF